AGERTRVWAAHVLSATTAARPGQIVAASAAGIDCSTGQGLLRLLQLQRPGGRTVTAGEYLKARPLKHGMALRGGTPAGR
ncbi:MAG: hypothetical protein ACREO9_04740, partial [Lysobacterales bacterium]